MHARPGTDISEDNLVRWLFTDCPAAWLVREQLGIGPTAELAFRVTEPIIRNGQSLPGDIDVMVWHESKPEHTTAIECKRIKVKPAAFATLRPNKLRELRKGVEQANALCQLGFHRCYLLVIVVVDGRERTDFNFAFRGLSADLVRTIEAFPERAKLLQPVGLVFAEVTQPIDKQIQDAAGVGVRIMKAAAAQPQPKELTLRVRRHLRQSARRMPNRGMHPAAANRAGGG